MKYSTKWVRKSILDILQEQYCLQEHAVCTKISVMFIHQRFFSGNWIHSLKMSKYCLHWRSRKRAVLNPVRYGWCRYSFKKIHSNFESNLKYGRTWKSLSKISFCSFSCLICLQGFSQRKLILSRIMWRSCFSFSACAECFQSDFYTVY